VSIDLIELTRSNQNKQIISSFLLTDRSAHYTRFIILHLVSQSKANEWSPSSCFTGHYKLTVTWERPEESQRLALKAISGLYLERGQVGKAMQLLEEAKAESVEVLGPSHPMTIGTTHLLARIYSLPLGAKIKLVLR
jgi:hypothetical protein